MIENTKYFVAFFAMYANYIKVILTPCHAFFRA